MTDRESLRRIISYLEENLRASKRAGLPFLDPRNFRSRILNKQNHVVFGRRGAGKTSLLSSLESQDGILALRINLEDYKRITFPNIILYTLIELFDQLEKQIGKRYPLYRLHFSAFRYRRDLRQLRKTLDEKIHEPDHTEQNERTLNSLEGGIQGSQGGLDGGLVKGREKEVSRSVQKSKLDFLNLEFPNYKKAVRASAEVLGKTPVFLLLDDFYFVRKTDQPKLIDYLHRLAKGAELFLKLATIKHRTKLYTQTGESYVGVEVGHDIQEIDMDYTLDKFDDLKRFMRELLLKAADESNVSLDVEELFAGEGFNQLCLASGGVPRDFLALFVRLANQVVVGDAESIGKVLVNEAAIANIGNKYESMRTDSAEERDALERCLDFIKDFVYDEKRTNAFLVSKPDLAEYPYERQAIKELVDLRLIHLIDENTSKAPSDGLRYEAYMLDVGLYDNSRPRNFKQIQPGSRDEKSRKDALRASPKLDLGHLRSLLMNMQANLELSEFGS